MRLYYAISPEIVEEKTEIVFLKLIKGFSSHGLNAFEMGMSLIPAGVFVPSFMKILLNPRDTVRLTWTTPFLKSMSSG